MRRSTPLLLFLLTGLPASQSQAALVVSNLGHSRLFDVTVSDSLWHASAFVSGADITLDSVDLLLADSGGGGNFGVEILVQQRPARCAARNTERLDGPRGGSE